MYNNKKNNFIENQYLKCPSLAVTNGLHLLGIERISIMFSNLWFVPLIIPLAMLPPSSNVSVAADELSYRPTYLVQQMFNWTNLKSDENINHGNVLKSCGRKQCLDG